MRRPLPTPQIGQAAAEAFVAAHLSHLVLGGIAGSGAIRGGQEAADAALAGFDIRDYAAGRNEVFPVEGRRASRLSPYIRHGLLQLGEVWDAIADGPSRDVRKFRDELLWQEFARHWYARHGSATKFGIRRELPVSASSAAYRWDRSMRCVEINIDELETDGWLVNQGRMWLSSQWSIRDGAQWQRGEDLFFQNLIDGSRAANRLGWQWTTGVGSSKHYGFTRSQVDNRAPGLCDTCIHRQACPVESWPHQPEFVPRPTNDVGSHEDPIHVGGPEQTIRSGPVDAVWLTAESLGSADPALLANPEVPAVFVFDEPLLKQLRLSAKRLVFLVETLAELHDHRDVSIRLGDPVALLADTRLAVTFAPVPGFRSRSAKIQPVEVHPWPWLCRPTHGSIASFSAWRKGMLKTSDRSL